MANATSRRTAASKYREAKKQRVTPQSPSTQSSQIPIRSSNHQTKNYLASNSKATPLLEQFKTEWKSSNVNSQWLEGIKEILKVLQSEEGKKIVKSLLDGTKKVVKKIPIDKVVNTLAKDQNLSEILKNLTKSGNSSEILSKMMKDPEMKKAAMDMMQEMLSDEKKVEEMTDLMGKMLNPDKE